MLHRLTAPAVLATDRMHALNISVLHRPDAAGSPRSTRGP